jgi:hypothetical protein
MRWMGKGITLTQAGRQRSHRSDRRPFISDPTLNNLTEPDPGGIGVLKESTA